MQKRGETYILQCPACGSRTFEIHGPTTDSEVVFCAECGAEVGELAEGASARTTRALPLRA
jgi:DNA-directed RNA polymerase subunit RPC12/RpoP